MYAKFDQVCLSKQAKQVMSSRCCQPGLSTVAVQRSVSKLAGVIELLASVSKQALCAMFILWQEHMLDIL